MSFQYKCDSCGYIFVPGDTRYNVSSGAEMRDLCVTSFTNDVVFNVIELMFANAQYTTADIAIRRYTVS